MNDLTTLLLEYINEWPLVFVLVLLMLFFILLFRTRKTKPTLSGDLKKIFISAAEKMHPTRGNRVDVLAITGSCLLAGVLAIAYSTLIHDTTRIEQIAEFSNIIVIGFIIFFIISVIILYKR